MEKCTRIVSDEYSWRPFNIAMGNEGTKLIPVAKDLKVKKRVWETD